MAVQQGDFGLVSIDTNVLNPDGSARDISASTARTIRVVRPDGSTFSAATAFLSDGTDGALTYVLASGDITIFGLYQWDVELVFPTGQLTTQRGRFTVGANVV